MLNHLSLTIALFIASTTCSLAEEVELRPKFAKGDQLNYDVEASTKQSLSLAGMSFDTEVTTFEVRHLEVIDMSGEGNAKLKLHTSKVQTEMSLPGGVNLSFDSDNPDREADLPQLNDVLKLLRAASQLVLNVEVTPSGEISEFSMKSEGLADLPAEMKSYLQNDRLKIQMQQEFKRIPREKVASGGTWTRSEIFDAGSGQLFTYQTTYKYEGTIEEGAKTFHKITATYSDPKFTIEPGGPLPITVKESDLSMEGSKLTLLVEPKGMHVANAEGESVFKGKITFVDPTGNEIPGELDLKVKSKVSIRPE